MVKPKGTTCSWTGIRSKKDKSQKRYGEPTEGRKKKRERDMGAVFSGTCKNT